MSEPMQYSYCDDGCGTALNDDNRAPSCGAHEVCVECVEYWTCGGCRAAMRELEDDARAEIDAKYKREAS